MRQGLAAPETAEDRFKKENIQPPALVGCFLSVILYPARCAGNVVFMGTFPESAAPPRAAFFFVRMYSSFTGGFVFRHRGDFRPRFPALRPAKAKESRNSRAAIADFRRPAAFFVVRVHRRAPRRRIPALRVPRRQAGRFCQSSVKLQQIKQPVNIPRAHHDQSVSRTQFPVQIPGNP